ncbi:uncharacterized protein BP5553_00230 [Venustampulla echinocandica]|uniref:NAD(P)-binding protein n=1 Tax=Venustampulla echinocandica TaxID=2656787 RepID=A0A370TXJ0_9HELO|nr:uncharacterized protein BP5553_00230 [Venustampulla echinocandica]RDL40251.1 hypothetical protein BP5553_00230 [Venustampulla echinocandica]
MPLRHELHSQLFTRPPVPTADFSGKTIIVTGSNVGLGKEAVQHFLRLKASKVIMAVRSVRKGEDAKIEITKNYKTAASALEVWPLDYSNYASCQDFAAKVATLGRVDAVVLNAGIATEEWELFEGHESQVTVNVISTTLLMLLILPTLYATAEKYPSVTPVLTVVGSGVHAYTKFPERENPKIFDSMDDKKISRMGDRYQVTKLMSLFAVREVAEKTASKRPFVIINTVNPGLCYTELNRSAVGGTAVAMGVMKAMMAWTAEEGGRTLVFASVAGQESHGVFISGSKIPNTGQSKFVTSAEGKRTQKKMWGELAEILERIQPGISAI